MTKNQMIEMGFVKFTGSDEGDGYFEFAEVGDYLFTIEDGPYMTIGSEEAKKMKHKDVVKSIAEMFYTIGYSEAMPDWDGTC